MTVSPQFEEIFVPAVLEQAALDTLNLWFPTYLTEIARQLGISAVGIPSPVNYSNRNSFDMDAGEALPKCVVISPGLVGTPTKDGAGYYYATWSLGAGVVMSAKDETEANLLSKIYGAAIRAIILQKRLGLTNTGNVVWIGESYDDLPISNQLFQARAASVYFAIDVDGVVKARGGPDVPNRPPANYTFGQVQADKVIIDIVNEGVNQLP